MKKKPLVSVLITSFNKEKYIKRCIKSCINQNYKNLEIIVFDDKSEDNSVNIIKKFKKVKLISNKNKKTNHWSFNQMNAFRKAFNKSKGKIICLLDADDFYHSSKISYVVKYFNSNKKKSFVFDLPNIFYNNNKIHPSKFKQRKKNKSIWPRFSPTSCMSMRRSFFREGSKNISVKKFSNVWMDFRFAVFAFFIKKDFNMIDKHLTFYVKNIGSATSEFAISNKNWWARRNESHQYMNYIFSKYRLKYEKSFDFYLTKGIYNFLN